MYQLSLYSELSLPRKNRITKYFFGLKNNKRNNHLRLLLLKEYLSLVTPSGGVC